MRFIMAKNITTNNSSLKKAANVVLCSVDCINPQLALESLILSSKHLAFDEVLLLSDTKPLGVPPHITFVQIPKILSTGEYSNFVLTKLHKYIKSDYCMLVQGDGYIHNPHLWCDSFKEWDYIGAPWPKTLWFVDDKTRVGNGGVSLRSKRLLRETSYYSNVTMNEDHFICQIIRDKLANNNIRIAPLEVAKRFSLEIPCEDAPVDPINECLAFHGKDYTDFHKDQTNLLKISSVQRATNASFVEKTYIDLGNKGNGANAHIHAIYEYAKSCNSIIDFGMRELGVSCALVHLNPRQLLLLKGSKTLPNTVEELTPHTCNANTSIQHLNVDVEFKLETSFDMIIINNLQNYEDVIKVLINNSNLINKYIIVNGIITWGQQDETKSGVGLFAALKQFLQTNKNWKELCTFTNSDGLTILQRIS